MNNIFQYSTLYFSPSIFTEESIAIGVLYIFPNAGKASFHYPNKLNRLKNFYPDLNDKLLIQYFIHIENTLSKKLNSLFESYHFDHDYQAFIDNCILNEDSTALKFGKIKGGIFYNSQESIIENYNQSIFGAFNLKSIKKEVKLDERSIVQKVKNVIKEIDDEKLNLLSFEEDKTVLNRNHVQFKADIFWKNCTERYSKAVSLDILDEDKIMNKSLLISSQLRKVSSQLVKGFSQVDLLIQKSSNPFLQDVINQSIDILKNDSEVEVKLYYDFENYGKEIAETAKP